MLILTFLFIHTVKFAVWITWSEYTENLLTDVRSSGFMICFCITLYVNRIVT